jgi:hypothetical protein
MCLQFERENAQVPLNFSSMRGSKPFFKKWNTNSDVDASLVHECSEEEEFTQDSQLKQNNKTPHVPLLEDAALFIAIIILLKSRYAHYRHRSS